jgi:hypothetical protein
MLKNKCVVAQYAPKVQINEIKKNDVVFVYQNKVGIIAVGIADGVVKIRNFNGERAERHLMNLNEFRELISPIPPSTIKEIARRETQRGVSFVGTVVHLSRPLGERLFKITKTNPSKNRPTTQSRTENPVKKKFGFDEDEEKVNDSSIEALEKRQAKCQGFMLDSKLRKALEDYAMDAAKRYFTSHGYSVEDCSKNHPYDLKCSKRKKLLYVEVKGTQTNGNGIFLTVGEVEHARSHKGQMALFLYHSIDVSENSKILSGGRRHLIECWDIDQGILQPISYKYELKSGSPNR